MDQDTEDHAIQEQVLKGEVNFHLDAFGQVIQDFNRTRHLLRVVHKVDVVVVGSIQPERVHFLELCVRILGLRETLSHVFLQQVDLGKICLDTSEEVKNSLVCCFTLAHREQGTSQSHLQSLRVLEESFSKGSLEALVS